MHSLIRSMSDRMPWIVGGAVLRHCNLPTSMGWERTIQKCDSLSVNSDTLLEQAVETGKQIYEEHLLGGEKSLRLYKMDDEGASLVRVRSLLEGLTVQPSPFSREYPYVLNAEALRDAAPLIPMLVEKRRLQHGMALVFCSKRFIETREELSQAQFGDDAREFMANYQEIIGVKRQNKQFFDVVLVPNEGQYIDVRVDTPIGMSMDHIVAAHEQVRQAFNSLMGSEFLSAPKNLFPLISAMYNNADEGIVVEMAFATTTGSLKHEKMRRQNQCLRAEIYHRAGKSALDGNIDPYRISLSWTMTGRPGLTSYPELTLHGSSRMLHTPDGNLSEAVIRKCVGLTDFEEVRGKIIHYLDEQ